MNTHYFLWILGLGLICNELFSLKAEDGLVLGVEASNNVSEAQIDSADSPNASIKLTAVHQTTVKEEELTADEIHSSFEDLAVTKRDSSKKLLQSDPSSEAQPQHVNIATELTESGQAAVVYTLVDSASSELQRHAAQVLSEQNGSAAPHTHQVTIPLTVSDAHNDSQYVVRAAPRQEQAPPTTAPSVTATPSPSEEEDGAAPELLDSSNTTQAASGSLPESFELPPVPPVPTAQEDIPSFSEWAQKQLAEAEKKKGENITGGNAAPPVGLSLKARHNKNYASPDCGAKVLLANPEAVSAGAVLSPGRDEYLLNTCTARTWFIVELCEAIQPKKVEIANFELFSSSPRDFSVYLSDRYPTRDWALAGRFTAQDERTVQAFNLSHTAHFGKYVKMEVHSHYGKEHYCPVSLFRVYGTSEIEVLDTVDEGLHGNLEEDDEDLVAGEGGEAPKNLFGSARDAVLSIVKKAAEALGKSPEEQGANNTSRMSNCTSVDMEPCVTPSHLVVCINCSDEYYNRMYHLMSCQSRMLSQLLCSQFVRHAVLTSDLCAHRGLDLRSSLSRPSSSPLGRPMPIHYLQALLPEESLTALCNLLAVEQKKVVLNKTMEQIATDDMIQPEVDTLAIDEPTPVLPDVMNSITEASSVEEDPSWATRTPDPPPHVAPLPIRPSRTIRDEELKEEKRIEENTSHPVVTARSTVTESVPMDAFPTPTVHTATEEAGNQSYPGEKLSAEAITQEDSGSLDSLFSELEQAVETSPRAPPAPQKESVFVRLANRIKALERNMSLSGQYLEELSRRYKRQVEEMQKALGVAVEERRRAEQRERERMEQLSGQVEALSQAVRALMEERDSWHHKATVMGQHGVIVVVEVAVFAVVLYICRWLPEVEVSSRKFSVAWPRRDAHGSVTRRMSVDEALPQPAPRARKRRPSEEALVIAGNTHKELLIPEMRRKISKGETRRQRRKRRKEMLAMQSEGSSRGQERSSLLDSNSTESVAGWWEEETLMPVAPLPSLPPPVVTEPPHFVTTALAQRQERIVRTSSENSDKENRSFLTIKKPGPFKKIVKRFF